MPLDGPHLFISLSDATQGAPRAAAAAAAGSSLSMNTLFQVWARRRGDDLLLPKPSSSLVTGFIRSSERLREKMDGILRLDAEECRCTQYANGKGGRRGEAY